MERKEIEMSNTYRSKPFAKADARREAAWKRREAAKQPLQKGKAPRVRR